MKAVILLVALIGAIHARPLDDSRGAYIVKFVNDVLGFGGFSFNYEQSDGIKHQATGEIKNEGRPDEALAVQGEYSYVGPDNQEYKVYYTADENGFQPAGEHIPPAASTRKRPQLGVPSAAVASLAGGGLG